MRNRIFPIAPLLSAVALCVGCIMPPRGVEWPTPRPLEQIAEHRIQVNQVGYFQSRVKVATLISEATDPIAWELVGPSGTAASGTTTVYGPDADSGDPVHIIDFSSFKTPGAGYTLRADGATSRPFAIGNDLYRPLARDAIRYFYLNRSGMPLQMPFVENRAVARRAGHVSDRSVPCEPGLRCKGRKDVSGGWYDAGDYGKYVVNAGISVWLLLDIHERLVAMDKDMAPMALNIPESDNQVPDLLDEARYEIEWMLKMQVTDGEEAGLVHHRVRNTEYTALGFPPPEVNADPPRYLQDTSTTATLNLAAVAARCSRVYRTIDAAFADRCLQAAKSAFDAARRNPFLPARGKGHVPYGDADAEDEVFWAAAELFVVTGDKKYEDALRRSRYLTNPSTNAGGSASTFNWQQTDGMGTLALAAAAEDPWKAPQVDAVIAHARRCLELIDQQGYRFPMSKRSYPWGSNSFILNNAVVLIAAHQLTGDDAYLDGAVLAMDYILGRNPIDFSYVSGYGESSMAYPHHRYFAPTYNNRLPRVPPGFIAGGPNPSLQDNAAKAWRAGCAPAKCYVDSIESFSTNEVAINWNAALAFVAAYLDAHARSAGK